MMYLAIEEDEKIYDHRILDQVESLMENDRRPHKLG